MWLSLNRKNRLVLGRTPHKKEDQLNHYVCCQSMCPHGHVLTCCAQMSPRNSDACYDRRSTLCPLFGLTDEEELPQIVLISFSFYSSIREMSRLWQCLSEAFSLISNSVMGEAESSSSEKGASEKRVTTRIVACSRAWLLFDQSLCLFQQSIVWRSWWQTSYRLEALTLFSNDLETTKRALLGSSSPALPGTCWLRAPPHVAW